MVAPEKNALEAFTLEAADDGGGGGFGRMKSSLEKVKNFFADALKNAIYHDASSDLPIAYHRLPYFIVLVSFCEVAIHEVATSNVRDALIYDPRKKCELWRFLSYMLLHNNYVHLGLNIAIQFLLGSPLEFEQGHLRTAAVYAGGGLGGSLGASVLDTEFMLVGASGGIYALLLSQTSHILLNFRSLKHVVYRSLSVAFLASADLAYICYHIYVFNNESPRISLAAHFAGALSGFLLGNVAFKGSIKWKSRLRAISACLIAVFSALAIVWNLSRTENC